MLDLRIPNIVLPIATLAIVALPQAGVAGKDVPHADTVSNMLTENSGNILLENGGLILLEN